MRSSHPFSAACAAITRSTTPFSTRSQWPCPCPCVRRMIRWGATEFTGAFFAAPMGMADPAERISAIRALVQSLRGESALDTISLMAPVLNRTPPAVGAAASRLVAGADISASNFPGIAHETFIAGARVERIYPFGPLPGVAIMGTMTSHAGVCCIGLNIDGSAVSDCDVLVTCLSAGFDEVLSMSKTPPRS